MTPDPTITIAGLRAQVDSLEMSLRGALDDVAAGEEVRLIAEAEHAAVSAERTALAAQLAEVRAELDAAPKVCAIHSYALEGPCMTCGAPWPGAEKALRQERIEGMEKMRRISRAVGCPNSVEEVVEAVAAIKADLASERAHLAACQTRIAGMERAANERSGEVARLTARVAELEARPVLDGRMLAGAISHAHDDACARWAGQSNAPTMTLIAGEDVLRHLGPVTLPLPAQDRAEDLSNAYVDEWNGRGDCRGDADAIARRAAAMRRALASLGAPPTSPGTAAGVPVTPERGK